jgi:hypothetical protein
VVDVPLQGFMRVAPVVHTGQRVDRCQAVQPLVQQGVQAAPVVEAEDHVGQPHQVAVLQRHGVGHRHVVDVAAVGRSQVDQRDAVRAHLQRGMAAADAMAVDLQVDLVAAAQDQVTAVQVETLASAGAAVADQARPPRAVERLEQRDLARVEREGLWVLHGVSVGRFDATPGCRGDPIW